MIVGCEEYDRLSVRKRRLAWSLEHGVHNAKSMEAIKSELASVLAKMEELEAKAVEIPFEGEA